MNVAINTPEVYALRRAVEQKSGILPQMAPDLVELADKVKEVCRERLSVSTFERLWQYSTRNKNAVSQHTLDLLSRYVGYADFADFRRSLATTAHPESGEFKDGILDVATLAKGDRLRLAWLPDRVITVEYQGDNRFTVRESRNSSLQPGDSFECLQLQKGQPMYLDRYTPAGGDAAPGRYVAGKASGITSVEIIK